jgi:hypothetical protein
MFTEKVVPTCWGGQILVALLTPFGCCGFIDAPLPYAVFTTLHGAAHRPSISRFHSSLLAGCANGDGLSVLRVHSNSLPQQGSEYAGVAWILSDSFFRVVEVACCASIPNDVQHSTVEFCWLKFASG